MQTISRLLAVIILFAVPCYIHTAGNILYADETELNWGKQPVRISMYEFGLMYDSGKDSGIDKDLIVEISRRTGCRFDIRVMTSARQFADLESGELDIRTATAPTPEREKLGWFAYYVKSKNLALVESSTAGKISSADGFIAAKTLRFGIVNAMVYGVTNDRWIAELKDANRIDVSPDVKSVFMKLREKRIGAMFAHPVVYRKYLRDLEMENAVVVQDWTPGEEGIPGGLLLSKKRFSEKDALKWQYLIREMKDDGTLKKIYSRYLPEEEADKLSDF